jgi:hypothetical protein
MIRAMVPKTTNLHYCLFLHLQQLCLQVLSKGGVNTLTLVINYLIEIWIHVHVTIGLFEVHETIGLYVARKL